MGEPYPIRPGILIGQGLLPVVARPGIGAEGQTIWRAALEYLSPIDHGRTLQPVSMTSITTISFPPSVIRAIRLGR